MGKKTAPKCLRPKLRVAQYDKNIISGYFQISIRSMLCIMTLELYDLVIIIFGSFFFWKINTLYICRLSMRDMTKILHHSQFVQGTEETPDPTRYMTALRRRSRFVCFVALHTAPHFYRISVEMPASFRTCTRIQMLCKEAKHV